MFSIGQSFRPVAAQIGHGPTDLVDDLHTCGMDGPGFATGGQTCAHRGNQTIPDMPRGCEVTVDDRLRHTVIVQQITARGDIFTPCACVQMPSEFGPEWIAVAPFVSTARTCRYSMNFPRFTTDGHSVGCRKPLFHMIQR